MEKQLIEDLYHYFKKKDNLTPEEDLFFLKLTGELSSFPIISVSRDDLIYKGFDTSKISDSDMLHLANKLKSDYLEQLYWSSMEILAEEVLSIPRYICPQCGKRHLLYNSSRQVFYCLLCHHEWEKKVPTGWYVLVEFTQETAFFEQSEICPPCLNSKDMNAIYVPELFYKEHMGIPPEKSRLFKQIPWPESQKYLGSSPDTISPMCEVVDMDESREDFGMPAVWVPFALLE